MNNKLHKICKALCIAGIAFMAILPGAVIVWDILGGLFR